MILKFNANHLNFDQSGLSPRFLLSSAVSRQEIDQLGSSFISTFILFPVKIAGDRAHGSWWKSLVPSPYWQPWSRKFTVTAILKMLFIYYNYKCWAKITLNIKELMIDVDVDVDVKINDLLPFCSKVFPRDFLQNYTCWVPKWLCSCWFFQVSLQQRGPWGSLSETVEKLLVVKFSIKCIVV